MFEEINQLDTFEKFLLIILFFSLLFAIYKFMSIMYIFYLRNTFMNSIKSRIIVIVVPFKADDIFKSSITNSLENNILKIGDDAFNYIFIKTAPYKLFLKKEEMATILEENYSRLLISINQQPVFIYIPDEFINKNSFEILANKGEEI